jgi:formimidoylglutamase
MMSPPEKVFFKGRPGDPRIGEWAEPASLNELASLNPKTFILLGSPDDTGVKLNRGRPGASKGPDAIRAALYKFAWPLTRNLEKWRFLDVGNVIPSADILTTHTQSYAACAKASVLGATVIAVGGGHDFAAPHILGTFSAQNKGKKALEFGVINVDPHLDVRELENGLPHSGTPFRQIIESGVVKGSNLIQFGARDGRNARAHFEFCKKHKVKVLEFSSIYSSSGVASEFKTQLKALSRKVDSMAVTIDMDSCADIEGVSAAPVIGFSPWDLCQFAFAAGKNPGVKILEIAEIAPDLDPSGRAPRIAAEVIFHFIMGRLNQK